MAKKIKNKIIIPCFMIILIAIITTWIIVYNLIQNSFKKQYIERINSINQIKEKGLKLYFDHNNDHINNIKSTENANTLHTINNNNNNKLLNESDVLNILISKLDLYSNNHKEILMLNFTDKEWFIKYRTSYANNYGEDLENNIKKFFSDNINKKLKKWYDISEIIMYDKTSNIHNILFLSILIEFKWEPYWYISVGINTNVLENILNSNIWLWKTWESYIVDKKWLMFSPSRFVDNTKSILKVQPDIIKDCFNWKNIYYKLYKNYLWYEVYWTHKYIKELNACLITEISKEEILSEWINIIKWYILSAIIVFFPMYFSIRRIINKALNPLKELENQFSEIVNWNLNWKITIQEDNEIWEISKSFQIMLEQLKRKDEEVNIQVEAQTKKIKTQKEITDKLNVELKKFELAVNNATDFITIMDSDLNPIYINNSFIKEIWYTLNEIKWKDSHKNYRSKSWEQTINEIMDIIKLEKETQIKEFEIKRKDGSLFITEAYITPIIDDKNKIIYYFIIERDVTKEREINKMKDEFISIVSHELRTPMTVINGYCTLLIDEKIWDINEVQKKYLDRIRNNTTELISIVNQMLDLWKLEAKKMKYFYEEINIKEFIEQIVSWFEDLLKQKNIKITLLSENKVIKTDKWKMKQVIINFISNSYKFTPNDGIITIIAKVENKMLKISVIDNWIWVKKEDQSKLFKKFSQIDSPLQREEKWTGLWLVVCKYIVEDMWWKIWMESEYQNWSTFYFHLPI